MLYDIGVSRSLRFESHFIKWVALISVKNGAQKENALIFSGGQNTACSLLKGGGGYYSAPKLPAVLDQHTGITMYPSDI